MTVIVWDGKTLVADRLCNAGDRVRTMRKIYKINGCLVGVAGSAGGAAQVLAWFRAGANLEDYPECQKTRGDDSVDFWVITPERKTLFYEGGAGPIPIEHYDRKFAEGSGSAAAMGALAAGVSAKMACKAAIEVTVSCGGGIDELTFDDPDDE